MLGPALKSLMPSLFSGSWRTSIFGVGGLLYILTPWLDGDPATVMDWNASIPLILVAIGLGAARDDKVSSEAAGVK